MSDLIKKYPCYIKGVEQKVPNVQPGTPIYANCVRVGNLLFISGMTAQSFDSGVCEGTTAEEQTRTCYGKMKQVLENAGSSLDNLVRTLILFQNIYRDYKAVRTTEYEFFKENAPSLIDAPCGSTVLQASLARPEFLVEIEAIAVVED